MQGLRPIHYASMNRNIEIVNLLLQRNCNIECDTKWKYRPIHYASENGHYETVKLLLQHKCNIDFETAEGLRPIHCASMNGHVEIVKLLLQKNCQINCKTKDKRTPLDLARANNKMDCVELLYLENLFAAIRQNDPIEFDKLYKSSDICVTRNLYTELSVLEFAVKNNADKMIKSILDKPTNNKEIKDLWKELKSENIKNINLMKECILYFCIIHQYVGGFKQFNTADVINGHCRIAKSTFLEISAEQDCDVFVDEIMKKTIYDKFIWINAINKAKEKGFMKIQKEITERMIMLESRLKENFTILHTAISDNDADMVKYILDHPNIVDLNSNNETFGTALSLAHSLHHRKCIRLLQHYQLNTNTQNKYSQTPLHEAIESSVEDNCKYLIDRAIDIDQIEFMGLTFLHCAVILGLTNVCAQLVDKGADNVKYVEISHQSITNEITIPFRKSIIPLSHRENSLTLSIKFHGTLFPCFIDRLDSNCSNAHDGDNNSLLHLAVRCLQPNICRSLLKVGANVNKINKDKNSPLLDMFYNAQINVNKDNLNKMIEITNILVEYEADVNIKSSNGISVFQFASIIGSEKLMLTLITKNPTLREFSSNDFQMAFFKRWFEYAEKLIKLLPDKFLLSNITNEIFQQCKTAKLKLIISLFDKSSSDLQQSTLENLLYDAVNNDDNDLFEHFIQTQVLLPTELAMGETLLTFILKENKYQYAWKLLKSINKVKFINMKNGKKQSPVQVAIEIGEMDLVDSLIHDSNELDCEDSNGKSVLTQLLEKISSSNNKHFDERLNLAIKSAILLGGDIYKVTTHGQRVIDSCTNSKVKAEFEDYHQKHFRKIKQ